VLIFWSRLGVDIPEGFGGVDAVELDAPNVLDPHGNTDPTSVPDAEPVVEPKSRPEPKRDPLLLNRVAETPFDSLVDI
jgi:hypothetical protein